MGVRTRVGRAVRRAGEDRVFTSGFSLHALLFPKIQNQKPRDHWNGILRDGVLGFG